MRRHASSNSSSRSRPKSRRGETVPLLRRRADIRPGLMTVVRRKVSLIAAALVLSLGLLMWRHHNPAFAQNEPEPEETAIEQPQAEPTEFTPVTAGEAERGAPSPEASSSINAESAPAGSSIPAAASSPPEESSPQPTPIPKSTSTPSRHRHATEKETKTSKAGAGPNIVPENSPFAGFNFGNQKGPT